jgi:hypothetical protein
MIVCMGKKIDIATPAAATTESPAPINPSNEALASNPATPNGDSAPAKAAVKKKPAKAAARKAAKPEPVTFSTEDIALRAYFISERRHRSGLPGDEQSDWIEAERQLHAEHRKKTAKKAPAKKTPAKKKRA